MMHLLPFRAARQERPTVNHLAIPRGTPLRALLLAASLLTAGTTRAILFYSTDDPNKNTTAPEGDLVGSGWQFQGFWRSFAGTPVGPHHFVTAKHTGGSVGSVFTLNAANYTTTAVHLHPEADLAVWEVAERFPAWPPLYASQDEVGKSFVVFGRGRKRGPEVTVDGATPSPLRGWRWGSGDGRLRWGENMIVETRAPSTAYPTATLVSSFDRDGGANEAHIATGDSGGALFVKQGSTWKLAGIVLAVDGYFSLTGQPNTWFSGSLLDMGGLYLGSNQGATLIADTATDQPSRFYAARISAYADWIRSVAPLPSPPALLGVASRKTHGSAGTFDVELPLTGPYGVECRLGPGCLVVFTFDREVVQAGAEILQGNFDVEEIAFNGQEVWVSLGQVANPQWITLALTDVTDTQGGRLEAAPVTFALLEGDVTGNGYLTSGDLSVLRGQIGRSVGAGNFRMDVTANGYLTSGDLSAVRGRIGTILR